MNKTNTLTQAKLKFMERLFPDASEATMETVEILMDLEQMSTLLNSFEDIRKGRVIALKNAFSDL
ncbi:MAG: hypothetical protein K2X66_13795 [Cyanobacteria bacterium]|jgi:hypothetical protein|nr:hypothetical protein [Cyanobacteriota bacterium]